MTQAKRIGVATFVMRSKQYVAALRPDGNVLVLATTCFADEVRDPAEEIVSQHEPEPSGRVVDLLEALQASIDRAKGHRPGNRGQQEDPVVAGKRKDTSRTSAT